MNALFDLLKRAEGTGEVITLAYGGGSRPGEARQVRASDPTKAQNWNSKPNKNK
ncbi:MAG: hypothetical protein IPN66_06410 [Candidatus Competibacteraceae bacterium]|nr:hypothetical protein [Candidatus Competibacteraceae bacterium]